MARLIRSWLETYNRYKGMVVDYLRNRIEYFNDNSTLKAFGHVITLSRIPRIKRAFWTVTVLASFYAAASVLVAALEIYRADAVTFSVETDYLHWDTAFPSVTVCAYPPNKTLIKEKLSKRNWNHATLLISELITGTGCKLCKGCISSKSCAYDVEELLDTVKTSCEEMFGDCWWNGEQQPCCELFKPLKTSVGLCYVFNSQFDNDDPLKYISRVIGVPTLVFTTNLVASIKMHSPREIVYFKSQGKQLSKTECGQHMSKRDHYELIVRAEEIYSDISVKSTPKHNRECLLDYEHPDFAVVWPFKRYSYNACLWYCRALKEYKVCNCTNIFMPKVDLGEGIVPVCGVLGLACINKYKEELIEDCQCPMNCDEITYHLTAEFCTKNAGKRDDPGKTVIKVGQLPSLRIRRHAIRDMLGLVVDFGGVIGVFFGASLLSFIEIVYIFCIRRNM